MLQYDTVMYEVEVAGGWECEVRHALSTTPCTDYGRWRTHLGVQQSVRFEFRWVAVNLHMRW